MPFVAKYHLAGEWPLVENLKRIIERDQVEALAAIAGVGVLVPFPNVDPSIRIIEDPPYVAVQSVNSTTVVDDNERSADSRYEFRLFMAIGDSDPALLAKHLAWYKKALIDILTTATEADLTLGITTAWHDRPVFELGTAVNGEIGGVRMKNEKYLRTCEIQFFMQIKEVVA